MEIKYNKLWGGILPRVSIITPVFNRRKELSRAIVSVENQSCKDIEHIVIDDGSKEGIDDIMADYMDRAPYPIAYIKKKYGGVHTARNAGIKISRGELMIFLDSDDELVKDNIKIFTESWDSIPLDIRGEYREVNAFCRDQNGKRIGLHLPEGINQWSYNKAKEAAIATKKGEKTAILRGDLMRSNPWPEPEGVKLVAESVIWTKLSCQYKTWFIDDELRIYHDDTISICRPEEKKLTTQSIVNKLYNRLWFVNNGRKYGKSRKEIIISIAMTCILRQLLLFRGTYPKLTWNKIDTVFDKLSYTALWIPCLPLSWIYLRFKMK